MMSPSKPELAIIGAGASGMAAAWKLSQAGIRSIIFEKSRGLSGRAATRRKHGHHFDHGANFFRLDDPVVARLIQRDLGGDDLVEIPGDVHTFGADSTITSGDPEQNDVPKWTYRSGISNLGKLLLQASPLARIHPETRITRIERDSNRWLLHDAFGDHHGPYTHLVLTLPAPQCLELLETSGIQDDRSAALKTLPYHSQFTFVLGYASTRIPERNFHALVSTDATHPLAWLSFEEDKPGHVANGASVMVAQMSPGWTLNHYDTPPATLVPEVVRHVSGLLGIDLPQPDWWDSQRWKFAHPTRKFQTNLQALSRPSRDGLHFAGDGLAGKGRVPLAIKTGLAVAERIIGSP